MPLWQGAPDDIVFCIKAMPHDFYLTFPDNPALGRLKREQWVEYDVLGQFFGWGVMPCFVFDDQTTSAHFSQTDVRCFRSSTLWAQRAPRLLKCEIQLRQPTATS